jgi:glycosyltransferase involved in cell wall biosynthesis
VKPVLFVTGHAPAYRVGALARLHQRERIELALFGGRRRHGGGEADTELPFPHRHVRALELARLAASGRYRAVICPTGGRLALLATWAGTRAGRTPLILWASLWAHPRTAAHALSYPLLRRLYRSADAVVTYGTHVSAYVIARGARNVHVAAQSVDNDFWSARETARPSDPRWPGDAATRFLFVGRADAEKGLAVLAQAWRAANTDRLTTALVLVGVGADSLPSPGPGETAQAPIVALGRLGQRALREVYAGSDVLVVPSIATRTFREPWGLVVNEAMNQGLAVISSDAVGAAAGGLVRDGANGLIVAAGDPAALAGAIATLAGDGALRNRLGETGARDVRAFSHDAWAGGFSSALSSLGLSEGVGSVA